jgi:hypothetical protein
MTNEEDTKTRISTRFAWCLGVLVARTRQNFLEIPLFLGT